MGVRSLTDSEHLPHAMLPVETPMIPAECPSLTSLTSIAFLIHIRSILQEIPKTLCCIQAPA